MDLMYRENIQLNYISLERDSGEHRKILFVRIRNGHVFLKSGLKVKSQNQKKITIKLDCLFFFKNPLLNENNMDIFLR